MIAGCELPQSELKTALCCDYSSDAGDGVCVETTVTYREILVPGASGLLTDQEVCEEHGWDARP